MRHHAKGTSSGDASPSQEVLPTLDGASSKTKSSEIQRSSLGTELARAFELYGSLKEGVHVAGYTLERAWNHLECLLEEDRWKAVGFDNINTFLDSIQLDSFRILAEQRKRIANRIKELQPEASNRAVAKMLGVSHTTVDRDTGTNVPTVEQNPEEDQSEGGTDVPRVGISSGINTGVAMCSYAERGHDLYETPRGAVLALLAEQSLTDGIWECACGPGAIVRVLRERGHSVVATDLIDYGCPDATGGIDFLQQQSAPDGTTTILTNAPFKHADEFVRHALHLLPHGRVIMLLRVLFLETEGRRDILEGGRLARVYVFRNRLPIHRGGWTGPRDTNPMALAWFVWEPQHCGRPELCWLSYKAEAPLPEPGEMPPIPDFLRRAP